MHSKGHTQVTWAEDTLTICQHLQDHRKKYYYSVSTSELNGERRAQQRKHFKVQEADFIEHLSFPEHGNKKVYMGGYTWCSYAPE